MTVSWLNIIRIRKVSEPILKIYNHHVAACGDPPIVDSRSSDCYIGYFENNDGEQWIFSRDRETGRATLRGGDADWNTEFEVLEGRMHDLILAEAELLWLHACWISSSVARS